MLLTDGNLKKTSSNDYIDIIIASSILENLEHQILDYKYKEEIYRYT